MKMKHIKPLGFLALSVACGILALRLENNEAKAALSSTTLSYQLLSLGQTGSLGISITGGTATNLNVDIDKSLQSDLGFWIQGVGSDTDTSVITAVLSPSLDGTTATMDTLKVYTLAFPLNNITKVICMTNWSGSGLATGVGQYPHMILRYITNAAGGTIKCTNLFVAIPRIKSRPLGN